MTVGAGGVGQKQIPRYACLRQAGSFETQGERGKQGRRDDPSKLGVNKLRKWAVRKGWRGDTMFRLLPGICDIVPLDKLREGRKRREISHRAKGGGEISLCAGRPLCGSKVERKNVGLLRSK
jgi:hypothetical protein